jgi:Protein of unknown function (DUF2695)
MGVSADHIEECLALFEEHGGYCDCEVVMNAQERICPEWSPTGVTFLIAPGACPEDPAQERLLREHEAEADRRGAEFWNYGWGQSDYGLASKTTAGVLASQINPETMEVTHTWGTYEERERQRQRLLRMASEMTGALEGKPRPPDVRAAGEPTVH